MPLPVTRTTLPTIRRLCHGGQRRRALSGVTDGRRARRIFATAASAGGASRCPRSRARCCRPTAPALRPIPRCASRGATRTAGSGTGSGRACPGGVERGESALARRWLGELARKAERNKGLHECTRGRRGAGSPTYAGSAGTLAAAVFEGLFGVSLSADELWRSPSAWAPSPAASISTSPPRDTFVAYHYEPRARSLSSSTTATTLAGGSPSACRRRRAVRVSLDAKPPLEDRDGGQGSLRDRVTPWGHTGSRRAFDQNRRTIGRRRPRAAQARRSRGPANRRGAPFFPRRHGDADQRAHAPQEHGADRPTPSSSHGFVPNQQGLYWAGWQPGAFDEPPQMAPPTAPSARPMRAPAAPARTPADVTCG